MEANKFPPKIYNRQASYCAIILRTNGAQEHTQTANKYTQTRKL